MKEFYQKIQPYILKIHIFSLYYMAFWIPMYIKMIPYTAMLLWLATWFFGGIFKNLVSHKFTLTEKVFMGSVAVYALLQTISLFYSFNTKYAVSLWQNQLLALVFTLVCSSAADMYNKHRDNVLAIFVISNALVCLAGLVRATARSFTTIFDHVIFKTYPQNEWWNGYFYYDDFSLFHHPSYFAFFLCLALVAAFYLAEHKQNLNVRIGYYAAVGLFLTSIFLLSSRAGLASVAIIMSFLFIRQVIFSRYRWIWVTVIALSLVPAYIVAKDSYHITHLTQSLKDILKGEAPTSAREETDDRIILWRYGLKIVGENTFLGVGIGDATDEINKQLKENNYNRLAQLNLNAHNQFIQTWLESGILSVVTIFVIMAFAAQRAIKHRNILLAMFLIALFINLMTEVMFSRLAGIVYIWYFLPFLFFVSGKTSKTTP